MKIAIFTDSFFPGIGGTEKAVLGLANELSLEHDVLVACPNMKGANDEQYSFKVVRCNSLHLGGNEYCALPGLSPSFFKKIDEFAPDIIHCQSIYAMAKAGINYAKSRKLPIVMTMHTKFKTALKDVVKSNLIVNLFAKSWGRKLKKCDKICSVSRDMIDEIKTYGCMAKKKRDIQVVRNGAMFPKVKNHEENKQLAREKFELKESDNVLLFVGRIIKAKNISTILNSLKIIKDEGVDFKMLIVGTGPDLEYFKNITKKLNLENEVLFTGQITDSKLLSSIYSASDLFVFPSIFDNDSLTVVEASVHKTPSVVFEKAGSSERLTHNETGFIVERTEIALANKLKELLKNKDVITKVGENAEKLVPKNWSVTAKEYIEIYTNLLSQNK